MCRPGIAGQDLPGDPCSASFGQPVCSSNGASSAATASRSGSSTPASSNVRWHSLIATADDRGAASEAACRNHLRASGSAADAPRYRWSATRLTGAPVAVKTLATSRVQALAQSRSDVVVDRLPDGLVTEGGPAGDSASRPACTAPSRSSSRVTVGQELGQEPRLSRSPASPRTTAALPALRRASRSTRAGPPAPGIDQGMRKLRAGRAVGYPLAA